MDLVGTVASVSTGVVTVQPFSAGQLINLGSTSDAAANTLELSDAELDNITTGKLIIGRDDASAAGTITVSQVVSLALLAAPVVVLITGAKIDDTVAGSISASKLALRSKTGVGSAATPLTLESVGEVAAINGTSGGLFLDSNDTVTVGTVDGTIGIKNIGGGAITIETFANNANIVVNQSILTNGDIKLDADKNGTGSGTDGGTITIASTAQLAGQNSTLAVNTLANSITLIAEDNITVSDLLAVNLVKVTSTVGSVFDDGVETTRLQGADIEINAAVDIGSSTPITLAEVVTGSVARAVDVNLTSPIGTIKANATTGNVLINEISSSIPGDAQFVISRLDATPGSGKQLAVINSGGPLLVDTTISVANYDLLLGTVGNGQLQVSNTITNTFGKVELGAQNGLLNILSGGNVNAEGATSLQTGTGNVLISAGLSSTTGDVSVISGSNITLGTTGALTAVSATKDVILNAKRNVTIPIGSIIIAGDQLQVLVGQDKAGAVASIRGSITTTGGAIITGGAATAAPQANDSFIIVPSTTTTFTVVGGEDFNGNDIDSLTIDIAAAGATISSLTPTPPPFSESGVFAFNGAFKTITFQEIESITGLPPTEITDGDTDANAVTEGDPTNTLAQIDANSTSLSGGTVVFSLTDSAGGRFKIDSAGIVSIDNAALINFESNASHTITIRATDTNSGLFTEKTFTITVTNAAPTATNDSFSTNENLPIGGGNVLTVDGGGADTDPNGGALSVVGVGAPVGNVGAVVTGSNGGSFRIFSSGNFSFDPGTDFDKLAQGELATTTVTYTVSDGNLTSTATVTVSVTGRNDAPTLFSASFVVTGGSVSGTLVGSMAPFATEPDIDANAPNDTLTYTFVGGTTPSVGVSRFGIFDMNTATGVITLNNTANPLQPFHILTVQVSDGLATAVAQAFVVVQPVNRPPVAGDDLITTLEDQPVSFNVLSNDVDPEFTTISVSKVTIDGTDFTSFAGSIPVVIGSVNRGSLLVNANGNMTFTPTANYNGSVAFTYTVTDGSLSVPGNVMINVLSVNDRPVVASAPANTTNAEDDSPRVVDLSGVFTDVEDTTLTITASSSNGGLVTTSLSGTNLTLSFAPNASGTSVITLTATDSAGASVTTSFTATVNAVNDPPVLNGSINLGSMVEDSTPITITAAQLLANASDIDSSVLTVTSLTLAPASSGAGTIASSGPGTWTFTPTANFNGNVTFNYTVSDGFAPLPGTAAGVATLTVTAAPDLDTINVNGTLHSSSLNLSGNLLQWPNLQGNLFVIATDPNDAPGVEIGLRADMRFQPPAPRDPADPTRFFTSAGVAGGTINDNNTTADDDDWARWNYTFSINANTDSHGGKIGDFQYRFLLKNVTTNTVLANVTLEQAFTLAGQAALIPIVNGSTLFQDSINFEPSFGAAFDPNAPGQYSVEFIAEDRNNGTPILANKIGIIINHAPVANPDSLTATEDTAIVFSAAQLLGNDTDADGNALKINSVTSGTGGTAVLNADGSVTFTPAADFNGTAGFTYIASDSKPIDSLSLPVLVTVNVLPVNDAPVANDDSFSGPEDLPIVGNVATNDSDVDSPTLTFTPRILPAHGTLVMGSNGSFTYTPAPNFNGTDTFLYEVSDGAGGVDTAFVTITVTAVNDAPVAVNDSVTTNEDTAVVFSVIGNDTDIDGTVDPATVIAGTASNGTVSVNPTSGAITYTPALNFFGTDSFTYTVKDNNGLISNTATVTVTVTAVNDAPTVANAIADQSATEDVPFSFVLPANTFNDVDNPVLTITVSGLPAWLSYNPATRTFSGTPTEGAAGGTVTVTATDAGGLSVSDSFDVTVTAVNDAPVAVNDNVTTNEDTAVVFSVIGNDTDIDGTVDPATVVAGTASNGTVSVNPTSGAITYTPALNFFGTDSFTYTVKDNNGLISNTATVTVTVTAVNDAPTVANAIADQTATEDVPFSFVLPANTFNDVDNPVLTITVSGLPAWLSYNPATRTFSGTPTEGAAGGTVTVTATDAGGLSVSDSFDVTVTAVNDAPVAVNDSVTTNEDTAVVFSVIGNDTDIDGTVDPATVIAGTASNGTVSVNPTSGAITYTPALNFFGTDSFTYTVKDNNGLISNTATVTVTVTAVNDAPTVANAIPDQSATEDIPFSYSMPANTFNDVDNPVLTITVSGLPAWLSYNPATRTFSGTPTEGAAGGTVTVTATDAGGLSVSDSFDVTVTAVNDAPVAVNDSVTTNEDTAVVFSVIGNDTDIDGTVDPATVIAGTASNGTVSVNPTSGAITYTPALNFFGTDSFTYTVKDNNGLISNTATVTVTVTAVNDAPTVANAIPDQSATEDIPFSYSMPANTFNDVDNPVLTITVSGLPAWLSYNPATRTFSGTPTEGAAGGTVTVTATDAGGLSVSDSFDVTVTAVNDAPVAVNDSVTTNEDTAVVFSVIGNDTDIDGTVDPATVIAGTASNGTVSVNPTSGAITYTPALNFFGTDSFTYTVKDNNGLISNTATVTVTVTAVNDAPTVANAIPDQSATEDIPFSYSMPANTFNDVDDALLSLMVEGLPSWLDFNPATGTFSGTPTEGSTGGTVKVTAKDAGGLSVTDTFVINYTAVNDAPVAGNDSYTVDEDTTLTVSAPGLLGNDSDSDGPSLTLNTVPVAVPAHGTLTLNANGSFTYVPATNFYGTDTFKYSVTDGTLSSTGTVTITINSVNDNPVAGNDSFTGNEDTVISGSVAGNDSDVDSTTLTFVPLTQPGHGSLAMNADGSFAFTPTSNFFGPDSFSYRVIDGNGGSATAVVSLTINSVNDLPVGNNQSVTVAEDGSVGITLTGSDVETSPASLVYTVATGPAHGTLSGTAPNLTYTPAANYFGSDSFTFTVTDTNSGVSVPATVSITVTPVNDAPVANSQTVSAVEDVAQSITLTGSDTEGSPLSYIVVSLPANGTLTGTAPNLTYTPRANFNGTDSFTFKVNDGLLDSPTVTVTINVAPDSNAPVAVDDAVSTAVNAQVNFNPLANDSEGITIVSITENSVTTTLQYPQTIQLLHGTLFVIAEGTFAFSPTTGFVGTQTFDYTLSAGPGGQTDIGTVVITVAAGNAAPVAVDDSYTMFENGTLTTTDVAGTGTVSTADNGVLANDTDSNGDTLTAVILTGPANGTVTLLADGLFTYKPNTGFSGTDTFTYRVLDNKGGIDTGLVTIVVNPISHAPSGADNAITLTRDPDQVLAYSFTAADFGFTDTLDGDSLAAVKITTIPTVGTLKLGVATVNAGDEIPAASIPMLTYTPPANTFGTGVASFTFQVRDTGSTANGGANLDATPNNLSFNVQSSDTSGPRITSVLVNSTGWSSVFRDFVDGGFGGTSRGYVIPTGSAAQTAALPWINMNQVLIRFSENVLPSLDLGDFSIDGISGLKPDGTGSTVQVLSHPLQVSATTPRRTPLR